MDRAKAHPLPARDPVTGGPLIVTELEGPETGITIRGRFEMPRFARLSPDQAHYLETFLRCRGMLNSVEKELGISYPTARARLDAVLRALDLTGTKEEPSASPGASLATDYDTDIPFPQEPEAGGTAVPDYREPLWDAPLDDRDEGFSVPFEDAETAEEIQPEVEPQPRRSRLEVLGMLERGEITPEEAKKELGVGK